MTEAIRVFSIFAMVFFALHAMLSFLLTLPRRG